MAGETGVGIGKISRKATRRVCATGLVAGRARSKPSIAIVTAADSPAATQRCHRPDGRQFT
jgi:hypothetical protein